MSKLGDKFQDWLDGDKDSADNLNPDDVKTPPDPKKEN